MEDRKQVRVIVDGTLLRDALKWDASIRIVRMQQHFSMLVTEEPCLELVLEGEPFDPVPEGSIIPVVTPTYNKDESGEISIDWRG